MRYFLLSILLTTNYVSIAKELTTDPKFALIDPYWGICVDLKLPREVTIDTHRFLVNQVKQIKGAQIIRFNNPVLSILPTQRYYGKTSPQYYVKIEHIFTPLSRGQEIPGTLLYAQSPDSQYRLAGYVDQNKNIPSLDNQEINASIIKEALEGPSTPISSLPHELISHIISYLPEEDSPNFLIALFTNKELSKLIPGDFITNRLRAIQEQRPLKVIPSLLDQLLPYREYITNIELTNGAREEFYDEQFYRGHTDQYEKADPKNIVNNEALEKLSNFANLRELFLRLERHKEVTDLSIPYLPRSLEKLSIEGKIGPIEPTFFENIRKQCPDIQEIRLFLRDVYPSMLAGLIPYEQHIAGIGLRFDEYQGAVTDQDFEKLGEFKNLEKLQVLLIGNFHLMTGEAFKHIPKSVQVLSLKGATSWLGDNHFEAIGEACPTLKKIEMISLSAAGTAIADNVTATGIKALVDGCPLLESINFPISLTKLTNDSIRYLGQHCNNLQYLKIPNFIRIENSALKSLLGLNRLRYLELEACGLQLSKIFPTRKAVVEYLENLKP